jgi:hypothetical protein
MDVSETTVNAAAAPLNFTSATPVKFVPVIVTLTPTPPLAGVKLAIVGAMTEAVLIGLPLVTEPPGAVTRNGPVVAPAGTVV